MKVSFLIAGAQRSGTSALHKFLSQHPNICFANQKETHFFDNEQLFKESIVSGGFYDDHFHSQYQEDSECMVYGDATPIYLYWKPSLKRIYEYNKDIKLIFILRNPIERAFSHYNLEYNRKADKSLFTTAIIFERLRCLRSFPLQDRVYSYIDRGYYDKQISMVLEWFPMENLLFIKHEELMNNHQKTIDRVCEFINVPLFQVGQEIVFKTSYRSIIVPWQRKFLKAKFKQSIHNLERLLHWDCSNWLGE